MSIVSRLQLEKVESKTLAPYGMPSRASRGRVVPEAEHPYRTAYQRDRDRIIHTTAFRRLEYKTQVFVITEGDYYRTRLTHTLEVAQIGRTIARALGANEDLTEAICLVHDIGHSPFGHAGESILRKLMADYGGFDHNRQSLRVVEQLEQRFPDFPGLNLTYEVREGIVKHETEYDAASAHAYEPDKRGLLEAQICNAADEIAYNAHDLDDGLRAGLFQHTDLDGLDLWEMVKESLGWNGQELNELWRHRLIRRLINLEVTDLLTTTDRRLTESGVKSPAELQALPHNVIAFSDKMAACNRGLKDFLYARMYRHYRVMRMQTKAERILEELFKAYIAEPAQLPETTQRRLKDTPLPIVACDYIAGMTDRFALDEHKKLFQADYPV
jgi:dGTPase